MVKNSVSGSGERCNTAVLVQKPPLTAFMKMFLPGTTISKKYWLNPIGQSSYLP